MMRKGSSARKALEAISSKQLDFAWHQSSPKSKKFKETVETGVSTTGRQLPADRAKLDRLFVPLATDPFNWFVVGKKKWELRRRGRQYTRHHVRVGRSVEFRRGYRGREVLWGEIVAVIEADNIEEFFRKVPFREVIPTASSVEEAIAISSGILKVEANTPLLGFAIGNLR
jgi:ASC-1-like (ASCH) protein